MRIYKMTATFGKLQNETLTLQPGLNVITAPNEWGKSTWCAFLAAMLYGLDTRAKSTRVSLADKDRYAPWSGAPMEGRIDLNWKGRDITIERRSRGRTPLGEFIAYETASGVRVEELNAMNCGQLLLGVEQGVYRRSGFIRHSDLPVTQDEALRRRLNALVTTGDENSAGDRLAEKLKDLKNKCRYNRTGLLPQAEEERESVEGKMEELENLNVQCGKLRQRLDEIKDWKQKLQNHQQALAFADGERNAQRVAQARDSRDRAEEKLTALEAQCAGLPSGEQAQQKIQSMGVFQEQWNALQLDLQMLPVRPTQPFLRPPFAGMVLEDAKNMVRKDIKDYAAGRRTILPALLIALGVLGILGAVLLIWLGVYLPGSVAGGAALAAIVWGVYENRSIKKQMYKLVKKYGHRDYPRWIDPLTDYETQLRTYQREMEAYQNSSGDVEQRYRGLQQLRESLFGDREPEEALTFWQMALEKQEACQAARREAIFARNHFDTIAAMGKQVEAPAFPDELTYSAPETQRLLEDALSEQQRLLGRLGQYQGRMETIGDRSVLEQKLQQLNQRIARLDEGYSALSIALETLADARAELQRRFAPRIAKRAQSLMEAMTGGRYHSLSMGEDFTLYAGAEEETTLREGMWRSDGTLDQLYLSLRLAVAEALTPEAPLVLDDALVRFDDERMRAAVRILKAMGEEKQIILFTCQGREAGV